MKIASRPILTLVFSLLYFIFSSELQSAPAQLLETDHAVYEIEPAQEIGILEAGSNMFSDRNYKWGVIPKKLSGWEFTRHNIRQEVKISLKKKGWVFICSKIEGENERMGLLKKCEDLGWHDSELGEVFEPDGIKRWLTLKKELDTGLHTIPVWNDKVGTIVIGLGLKKMLSALHEGNSITPSAKPAGDRIWSQAETGKTITATLMGKSPDNSNVTLLIKGSPKTITAAADTFSREDREYIANWVPLSEKRVASDPNPTGAKSEQSPQGLVLRPPTSLDQGKGGFGIQIDELGEIMKPYGEPENDLAAHPGLVIYSGPAPKGGSCRITYLMKRAEAVEQLLGRTGLTMKLNPVLPGFPPGLSIYNYDRKFGDYDHMTLLVDDADQVVTLQFKSDSKAFGFLDGKWPIYNFKTLNYINLKAANGGRIQVRGRKNGEESVMVNIDHRNFRETVTWYVPKPLVRLILFNVREKQKVRK